MHKAWLRLAWTAPAMAAVAVSPQFDPTRKYSPVSVPSNLKLVQAQIFFRHGARTPLSHPPGHIEEVVWPQETCQLAIEDVQKQRIKPTEEKLYFGDKQQLSLPGGCSFGSLTAVGQTHARTLGIILRKRYLEHFKLLGDTAKPTDIAVESTDFPRTVASAHHVLRGLLGPQGENVEVHVEPRGVVDWRSCDAVRKMYEHTLERFADLHARDPHMQRVALRVGVVPRELQVLALYDIIASRHVHSMPMPQHLTPEDEIIVHENAVNFLKSSMAPSDHILSLVVSPYLTKIRTAISDAVDGHGKRLVLQSTHDTVIVPLLLALSIFDDKWPQFSASLAFELWQEPGTQNYFVKVLYNNVEQTLPCCGGTVCPLDVFINEIDKFIPADYAKACME